MDEFDNFFPWTGIPHEIVGLRVDTVCMNELGKFPSIQVIKLDLTSMVSTQVLSFYGISTNPLTKSYLLWVFWSLRDWQNIFYYDDSLETSLNHYEWIYRSKFYELQDFFGWW